MTVPNYNTDGLLGDVPYSLADQRQWAHEALDRLLDFRSEWLVHEPPVRSPFLSDQAAYAAQDAAARHLYESVLNFASLLASRQVKEAVTPTFISHDPKEMRRALAELLNLLNPVMPYRSKSMGAVRVPDCHWIDDLHRDLAMLDHGHIPQLFQPAKGRSSDWHKARYRFLGALWAIHLQAQRDPDPHGKVRDAFNLGPRGQDTVKKWIERFTDLTARQTGIDGIAAIDVQTGIAIAQERLAGDGAMENIGKSLCYCAFGRWVPERETLEGVGSGYQELLATIAQNQDSAHKPKRRAKLSA